MSADNTVIVLKTKAKVQSWSGVEYRVAEVRARENLFFPADYPSRDKPELNRECILHWFKGAPVLTSAEKALTEAARIDAEIGSAVYGIRIYDLSEIFFPATDRKRRQRRYVQHTTSSARSSSCPG